jgi:hypothetical protein
VTGPYAQRRRAVTSFSAFRADDSTRVLLHAKSSAVLLSIPIDAPAINTRLLDEGKSSPRSAARRTPCFRSIFL